MTGIRKILRFDRTVSDLARTEAFYRDGLGFVREGAIEPLPPAEAAAMGLTERESRRLHMRLSGQSVTFLALDPPGSAFPPGASATDPFFQHLAIPVRDMDAAFAHLDKVRPTLISRGGPQRLPASSGGVSAVKFRDPDGHPLELIHFPDGAPATRWAGVPGLFLGIDHSAVTVPDLDAALTFFTGPLGLTMSERGVNRGPEQARLDELDDPLVDVLALNPPEPAPHVELLHYRQLQSSLPTADFGPADRTSTRFVFAADDPAALAEALRRAGFPASLSGDGTACYTSGPGGHGCLILREG